MEKTQREDIKSNDKTLESNRQVAQAADVVRPYGQTWVGTIAIHFYAGMKNMSADGQITLITQQVNWQMSKEAGAAVLEEVRERVMTALGATKQRLAPGTNEEVLDTGGILTPTDKEILGYS